MPSFAHLDYTLKNMLRLLDALTARRKRLYDLAGHSFLIYEPRYWKPLRQNAADAELRPYFDASSCCNPRLILDIGAAIGMFTVPALLNWRKARVVSFEPGRRQRILLRRNARLNGVAKRMEIVAAGCWDADTILRYRAHAEIGGFEGADQLPHGYLHPERVNVIKLDTWWISQNKPTVDLLKMDIEGAELEALAGAGQMLSQATKRVMVEAYHIRHGKKTLEPCIDFLKEVGFKLDSAFFEKGLVVGGR